MSEGEQGGSYMAKGPLRRESTVKCTVYSDDENESV